MNVVREIGNVFVIPMFISVSGTVTGSTAIHVLLLIVPFIVVPILVSIRIPELGLTIRRTEKKFLQSTPGTKLTSFRCFP